MQPSFATGGENLKKMEKLQKKKQYILKQDSVPGTTEY
jgi:hypothetical protein